MFEPLSCYYGLAELPDLTHKSVPQIWRLYERAIKRNMPPYEVDADFHLCLLDEKVSSSRINLESGNTEVMGKL